MIIFLCNSDVGKGNTIGARLGYILQKLSSYKAFVRRDYTQNSQIKCIRGLDYIMKMLSAVPLITFDKISSELRVFLSVNLKSRDVLSYT